jgi:hypothetical protein
MTASHKARRRWARAWQGPVRAEDLREILRAMVAALKGKYRDALPSTDEVMAEKRAEALREDSHAPR